MLDLEELREQNIQTIVYSKSLKKDINLVIVYTQKKGKWSLNSIFVLI